MTVSDFELLKVTRNSAIGIEEQIASLEMEYTSNKDLIESKKESIANLDLKNLDLTKKLKSAKSKNSFSEIERAYASEHQKITRRLEVIKKDQEGFRAILMPTGLIIALISIMLMILGASSDTREGVMICGLCLWFIIYILATPGWDGGEQVELEEKLERYKPDLSRFDKEIKNLQSEINQNSQKISQHISAVEKLNSRSPVILQEIEQKNRELLEIWKSVEHLLPK